MTHALFAAVDSAVEDLPHAINLIQAAINRQVGILLDFVPGKPELTESVMALCEEKTGKASSR